MVRLITGILDEISRLAPVLKWSGCLVSVPFALIGVLVTIRRFRRLPCELAEAWIELQELPTVLKIKLKQKRLRELLKLEELRRKFRKAGGDETR